MKLLDTFLKEGRNFVVEEQYGITELYSLTLQLMPSNQIIS